MNIKLLPYTSRKTIDILAVDAVAITPGNRSLFPYPPGKVQVNGQYWPNGAHLGAVDAVLTWAHRHRWAQEGWEVKAQDAASIAAGPEGTYTVEVLINDTVIPDRTVTGIAGDSFTYTMVQRTADDADLNKPVKFRITPVNGALSGAQRTTDPFIMQT